MSIDGKRIEKRSGGEGEIMAATDSIDGRAHLIIADLGRDDSWAATPEEAAVSLENWR